MGPFNVIGQNAGCQGRLFAVSLAEADVCQQVSKVKYRVGQETQETLDLTDLTGCMTTQSQLLFQFELIDYV